MKIRKATIDDIEQISKIHALSWKTAYKGIVPQAYLDGLKENFWISTFQNWIINNILTAQIIFDADRPIGCAAYGKSRDEKLPDWGEIVSLYLLPEYFGKGIGKVLFQYVLEDMKKAGFHDIYLWVLEDNQRARMFYKKNGFSCSGDKYLFEIMNKQLVDVRYIYKQMLEVSGQVNKTIEYL